MRTERDILNKYKEEAASIPLLSHEEVVYHAHRMRRGTAVLNAAGLEKYKFLPPETENFVSDAATDLWLDIDLEQQIADAYASNRTLITSNLRLVLSWSLKYVDSTELSRLDLVQEGNIGLMHAVEMYDPDKGFKFSTYASWWIKQSMKRAMAKSSGPIRLPSDVRDLIRFHDDFIIKYVAEYDRQPSISELAAWLEVSEERVVALRSEKYRSSVVSLDDPVGDASNSATRGDLIPSDDASPEQVVLDDLEGVFQSGLIDELLGALSERKRFVVRARWGLGGHRRMTLEELGTVLGISRETARRLERSAMHDLRVLGRGGSLDEWSE